MKIFYRPIIDRIKDDVFILSRYDLYMLEWANDAFMLCVVLMMISVIGAIVLFGNSFKKAGWACVALSVIFAIGIYLFPRSREQYILDIVNRNSLTAEEFKMIKTKITEEADLRVPVKKQRR